MSSRISLLRPIASFSLMYDISSLFSKSFVCLVASSVSSRAAFTPGASTGEYITTWAARRRLTAHGAAPLHRTRIVSLDLGLQLGHPLLFALNLCTGSRLRPVNRQAWRKRGQHTPCA